MPLANVHFNERMIVYQARLIDVDDVRMASVAYFQHQTALVEEAAISTVIFAVNHFVGNFHGANISQLVVPHFIDCGKAAAAYEHQFFIFFCERHDRLSDIGGGE